jgi:hypothetical protein
MCMVTAVLGCQEPPNSSSEAAAAGLAGTPVRVTARSNPVGSSYHVLDLSNAARLGCQQDDVSGAAAV